MKRDIYAYLTTAILIAAISFSLFLVISDNRIPFTTQATVKTSAIEVITEVQGYVEAVMVTEGQPVESGTPLLQVDRSLYQLAVDKAVASRNQADSQLQQSQRYFKRMEALHQRGTISKEQLDEADSAHQTAAAQLQQAQAALKQAERDLNNTLVVAKHAGTVTNLTLKSGMYVTPASPVIHLIDKTSSWIAADFTEKGLPALTPNRAVNIVYDADPARVHPGHIVSVDSAILSGITSPGQLASITDETRWIRSQQKIRVRVEPDTPVEHLIAGGRASVMVRDSYHISDIWMTILSWMRVVY
ncbi:HlyD family secretion protein [Oceanobacter mangrovi]|uniref:HlyD family secretion protein n=1 Tax=Oceanobacter mangrovi TaxID=2862510 RepID=UPI001C8E3B0E|nr:efflux RND transporter periplasmic adaptor subunit [Oceanobacter mangrovi]